MAFVGRVPFSRSKRLGLYADGREFYNVLHARALSRIDESIRYLNLIWHKRRKEENFFHVLKRISKKSFIFKGERHELNFVAELFPRLRSITHARARWRPLCGETFRDLAANRACGTCHQDVFRHNFVIARMV